MSVDPLIAETALQAAAMAQPYPRYMLTTCFMMAVLWEGLPYTISIVFLSLLHIFIEKIANITNFL